MADSYEHLISEWIDTAFEAPAGWSAVGKPNLTITRHGLSRTRSVQRLATSLVADKSVCIPCNTTWMSAIENDSKDLLTPLIRGHRRTLIPRAQLQIGLWACLKAAVADARPDAVHGGLCSESIRAAIYERHEPPIDMSVRLAALNEGHAFAFYHLPGVGIGSVGQPLTQWVTTFVLGHLVVQILGRTGSILPSVLDQNPTGVHDDRSFTVWPPQSGTMVWPPRVVLGHDDLAFFCSEPCPQLEPATLFQPLRRPTDNSECPVCGALHGPLLRQLPTPEN